MFTCWSLRYVVSYVYLFELVEASLVSENLFPELSYWFTMNSISNRLEEYLLGVLHCFQHCTGHITTGSWKGRGNKYIQLVKVLYCKLATNSKQLPAFPLEAVPGTEPRPQRWEARVLPLCHHGPLTGRYHLPYMTYLAYPPL